MINDTQFNHPNNLLAQADKALTDALETLGSLLEGTENETPPEDTDNTAEIEYKIRTIQLVLQYRFDTQDALARLMNLQQAVLQYLGIGPQYSAKINMERMAFALGSDDLHQLLYALNQLVDSLLRIVHRTSHTQSKTRKRLPKEYEQIFSDKTTSQSKQWGRLQKAIDHQKSFAFLITQLTLSLQEIGGAPKPGIIYDYLAGLQGPISRFFQALQHGLGLSTSLYHQLNKNTELNNSLSKILSEAHLVLEKISPVFENQRLFSPAKEYTSEQLEQRAAMKRLGHFFNH